MTKFGGVINKARASKQAKNAEDQKTREPENQRTLKPDNQIYNKQLDLASPVETTSDGQATETYVNLSIRVPKRLRQHWAAEAKRSGTTLTRVVSEALYQKFGEP